MVVFKIALTLWILLEGFFILFKHTNQEEIHEKTLLMINAVGFFLIVLSVIFSIISAWIYL